MIMYGYQMDLDNEEIEKKGRLAEDKQNFARSLPQQSMPIIRGKRR